MITMQPLRKATVKRIIIIALLYSMIPSIVFSAVIENSVPINRIECKNVTFDVVAKDVVITYDLDAPQDSYTIEVVLTRINDKSFSIIPKTVSGNVGSNQTPGKGKKIFWDYLKDVPEGLQGEDYLFRVYATSASDAGTVAKSEEEGGFPWKWVLIILGLGGVVVAVLALKGSGDKNTNNTTPLPDPPGRP